MNSRLISAPPSQGKADGRKEAPPGRAGSQPSLLGERQEAQEHATWGNQQIKVHTAQTCILITLKSTAWAHLSFMSKTGPQDERLDLRDWTTGPREATEEEAYLETPQTGRKLPKVSLPRSVRGGGRL